MSRQIQIRRGTAAENDAFTGAIGEITMDTTNKTLRVHDGQTLGGTKLAKQSEIPEIATADYIIESQLPSSENNYAWYKKYKSGLVEIGGHYTGNANTINLPIELDNANYEVLFSKNSTPSYWATTHIAVGTTTTTSFTITKYGDNASIQISWLIPNAIAK
ncbi:MAG: hypothetical protein IKZ49_00865 [Alphaproteobacteria bacterium]|nr:hypothetical protein [Alphaproteobacteria bacterium]